MLKGMIAERCAKHVPLKKLVTASDSSQRGSVRHSENLLRYLLKNISDAPTVVLLEDNYQCATHCVCIVGCWIFGANEPRALPLTQESGSLDICAGDGKENNRYTCSGIVTGYRFEHQKMLKRKAEESLE